MSSPEDAGDGLTAAQLIEVLKEYPPDLPVVITFDGRLYWQPLARDMVYQAGTEPERDRMGSTSIWMFDGKDLPDALKIGG